MGFGASNGPGTVLPGLYSGIGTGGGGGAGVGAGGRYGGGEGLKTAHTMHVPKNRVHKPANTITRTWEAFTSSPYPIRGLPKVTPIGDTRGMAEKKPTPKKAKEYTPQPLDVFYSWQSDLDPKANRYRIRDALKKAETELTNAGTPISVHEATERASGSPDIAEVIFSKIRNADAFVADVSPVAKGRKRSKSQRKVPNPNVMLEAGYAIATLGTNRIVLVQNLDMGPITALPFDLAGKRLVTYRESETDNEIAGKLKRALRRIATHPRASLGPEYLVVPETRRRFELLRRELEDLEDLLVQWRKLLHYNKTPFGPHIKVPSLRANLPYLDHYLDDDDAERFFLLDVIIDTFNAQLSRMPASSAAADDHEILVEAVGHSIGNMADFLYECYDIIDSVMDEPFPDIGETFKRHSDYDLDFDWEKSI